MERYVSPNQHRQHHLGRNRAVASQNRSRLPQQMIRIKQKKIQQRKAVQEQLSIKTDLDK